MPFYYSRSIEVGLSIADLGQTTTAEPSRTLGPESTANAEHASAIFRGNYADGRLRETGICAEDGKQLRFLGECFDMPFIMVHARPNPAALISSNGGHSTRAKPSPDAVALSLTVRIPNKGLLPLLRSGSGMLDVKIDVFLNGQLCASTSVLEREGYSDQHGVLKVFSGARVGRLVERPWVLDLSSLALQRDLIEGEDEVTTSQVHKTWETVSKALESFVKSIGTNDHGKLPIIGEYLNCLARIPAPSDLSSLTLTGELASGIIDVVITTGKSRNKRSHDLYLMSPRPVRLPGFGNSDKSASRMLHETPLTLQPEIGDCRRSTDAGNAARPFSLHHHPHEKSEGKQISTLISEELQMKLKEPAESSTKLQHRSRSILRVRKNQSSNSPSTLIPTEPDQPPSPDATNLGDYPIQTTFGKHVETYPAPTYQREEPRPKKQRSRFHYHIVLSTEQTREEEIESLEAQAREDAYSLGYQTRSTRLCVANAEKFHDDPERSFTKSKEPTGETTVVEGENSSPNLPKFRKVQQRPITISTSHFTPQPQENTLKKISTVVPPEGSTTLKQPASLPPSVKRSRTCRPRTRRTKQSLRPPSTPASVSDQIISSPEKSLILSHTSASSHTSLSEIHVDKPQDALTISPDPLQQQFRPAITSSSKASTRATEPWEMSELCRKSMVTYAPDGVVRQVKGEKYVSF